MDVTSDFSLESIVGKPKTISDPLSVSASPVRWLSCRGDPRPLCKLIAHESKDKDYQGLPSPEKITAAGGIWEHLQTVTHESDLVSAEIHREAGEKPEELHRIVYHNRIIECRGMNRDSTPDIKTPSSLGGINIKGILLDVVAGNLVFERGTLPITLACGTKGPLSYFIANAIPDGTPVKILSGLRIAAESTSDVPFNLFFNASEIQPTAYRGELRIDSASIYFGPDGSVSRAVTRRVDPKDESKVIESTVDSSKWSTVFSIAFNSRYKIDPKTGPNIDVLSTLRNVIAVGLRAPAKISVDDVLSYR